MEKIRGGSTQRPRMEKREKIWSGFGFSIMSVISYRFPPRELSFMEEYFWICSTVTSLMPTMPFSYWS